ncbi:hypothetical protein M5J20_10355 [Corynebacterium sp. TA-R-1]|uniref:Secreted protein n=1 Tax=Corynebacterium stercoris TaxID=2943490 RepID=A0ABT1G3L2_9CORY|nr:hypothetical protein [Corynebacterium stercoris]MCP1388575.1 hypothetical protein [Corynebacterium stercoris]
MTAQRTFRAALASAAACLLAVSAAACTQPTTPEPARPTPAAAPVSAMTSAPASTSAAAESSAEAATVTETETQPHAPERSTANAAPQRGVPGAPLAYPGAGGPVPANARPVAAVQYIDYLGRDVALLITPSGNIGCELSPGGVDPMLNCGVDSYHQSRMLGNDAQGWPKWFVDVREGNAFAKGDVPLYLEGKSSSSSIIAPEVVQYGEVVHYGPLVCAVEATGVTCWDANTGRGAWLAREGATFF